MYNSVELRGVKELKYSLMALLGQQTELFFEELLLVWVGPHEAGSGTIFTVELIPLPLVDGCRVDGDLRWNLHQVAELLLFALSGWVAHRQDYA